MDNRPIGFFDSGVGGLSCVRALQKLLPNIAPGAFAENIQ